jgi:hypothetical protein
MPADYPISVFNAVPETINPLTPGITTRMRRGDAIEDF